MLTLKRHLTFEEQNAISAALDFYIKNGPQSTITANYSSSYPNEPERAIVRWDRSMFEILKESWEEDFEVTYEQMIEELLLTQMDDIYDHLNMIKALSEALNTLIKNTKPQIIHILKS